MKSFLLGLCLIAFFHASAQFPERSSSSELYHELVKASETASVLYMAAHPDDENTRLISYFENELHARTAYLSLTRGSGGQNLIGTEIGSAIGVLRTQELLAARSIDGGEQFFTRAVDFGYSKSADESFEKWGKERILRDVIWVIRKFRPDVIVTRFPPTNYAGHGHHQASAILAEEAFDLAADPKAFPEQLEYVDPWQPTRLYFNTSTWWVKDLADRAQNSEDYITINVGEYNPILGESYAQIAARSRSQHKSQGFGSDYPMGNQIEYLKYVKGERVKKDGGILQGITTDWSQTPAPEVGGILNAAIGNFNFENPSATTSSLAEALKKLGEADQTPLISRKIKELESLLLDLSGIEMGAYCDDRFTVPGDTLNAEIQINLKSEVDATLKKISGHGFSVFPERELAVNDFFYSEADLVIANDAAFGNPYWLGAPYTTTYQVDGYQNLGKPENEPQLNLDVILEIGGYEFTASLPLKRKIVDPAKAVLYSPVYIVPRLTAGFEESTIITTEAESKEVMVTAVAHEAGLEGVLRPKPPKGWICIPEEVELNFSKKEETRLSSFTIKPENNPVRGPIGLEFQENGSSEIMTLRNLRVIEYDHIPTQIELSPSEVEIVPIDLDRGGVNRIGYIEGPGDEVAKYLRAVGYEVDIISTENLISGDFSGYDAVVTGIRAYNTREDLAFAEKALNDYVKNGGTWLVQYNTTRGLKQDQIGPYPFQLSRERVTDETATPEFLYPAHPVLNQPNRIGMDDFDDWVQERGLYFANEWDEAFIPIIAWSDPEEPPRKGGLIVAPYGKGHFVYSGISFFRELPAGVSGAYRLLSNILALSQSRNE